VLPKDKPVRVRIARTGALFALRHSQATDQASHVGKIGNAIAAAWRYLS